MNGAMDEHVDFITTPNGKTERDDCQRDLLDTDMADRDMGDCNFDGNAIKIWC